MSSLFEKIQNILKKEKVTSTEIANGNSIDAKEDLEEIENKILSVLESEGQDLEELNQVINDIYSWEQKSEELIEDSIENVELIKAGISEQNKTKILRNAAKINERLVNSRDKVEPEDRLSESQLDYFKEINAVGKSLETVENLQDIIRGLDSKEVNNKEKKIEAISESLESILHKERELEGSETKYQSLHQEITDISDQVSSILSGEELKAVKTTLKNLSELIRDVGEFELDGSGLTRRDFLKIASASFIGLAAASQVYRDLEVDSKPLFNEKNLNRTERFLYEYLKEIDSWKSGKLKLGDHVIIAEEHQDMDAYISVADFIKTYSPDAVGLEFFYKEDQYLRKFNGGDIGVDKVVNHWNTHLGRGRPEEVQREILTACRRNGVDLLGLEPWRFGYTYGEEPNINFEKLYERRSLGMSETAAEIAERYDNTAFVVGYLHSGLQAMIPKMLLRSAKPKFKGKFDLRDFYRNPLRFTKYEDTKRAYYFYQNPELRINHKLAQKNFDSSLLKATSAEEQLRVFREQYIPLNKKTEKTELIEKRVEGSLQQLRNAQPISLQSKDSYSIMMRQPH